MRAAWSPVSRRTCAGRRCAGRRCGGKRGQGKGWSGFGLMRGCHTCRSRCISGSGCLGPLPPPVPPAPLLLPPPLPAPAPLLPLPLLPPLMPPLPRPPPAFSGEALRASGGGGGGSRLLVVVRSLHPSQPLHLHQEPERQDNARVTGAAASTRKAGSEARAHSADRMACTTARTARSACRGCARTNTSSLRRRRAAWAGRRTGETQRNARLAFPSESVGFLQPAAAQLSYS